MVMPGFAFGVALQCVERPRFTAALSVSSIASENLKTPSKKIRQWFGSI